MEKAVFASTGGCRGGDCDWNESPVIILHRTRLLSERHFAPLRCSLVSVRSTKCFVCKHVELVRKIGTRKVGRFDVQPHRQGLPGRKTPYVAISGASNLAMAAVMTCLSSERSEGSTQGVTPSTSPPQCWSTGGRGEGDKAETIVLDCQLRQDGERREQNQGTVMGQRRRSTGA